MINPQQFVGEIIKPSLIACDLYSPEALLLMTCTALVESKLTHIKQLPQGPALGFFQVEWATYLDVIRYLDTNRTLRTLVLLECERDSFPSRKSTLMADMVLNTLIARVKYWMQPEPLPSYLDAESLALYYKKYYNSVGGKATTDQFVKVYSQSKEWVDNEILQRGF